MVMDRHYLKFHTFRSKLTVLVLPLQMAVDFPIKKLNWLSTSVAAQQRLLEENARLRAHQLLLESKLQKLLELERENVQLRELLKSTPEVAGHVIVGQFLAVSLDPTSQQVVVDKGTRDNVYVGQPVLDAFGIIGQIVNVGPMTSQVLLITDSRSAVPVRNLRNGIRSIAVGVGQSDRLALINVPETTDVKKGDIFVSSGLGLRFPVGYPVGVVSKVQFNSSHRFTTIILTPSAHLNQSSQVLLAWPSRVSLYQAVNQQLGQPISQTIPQVKQ